MSTTPIVSFLLVLVCVHLHFDVAVGDSEDLWCDETLIVNHNVTQRTGTDALNARVLANKYLARISPADKLNGCGNVSLINISPGSGLQGTANASSNLNKLLYMYRSVWRYMALSGSKISEADSTKLDLLETVFTRLSNQVEWYLQFRRCVCNHAQCTVSENIDKSGIQQEIQMMHMQPSCTHMRSLNVIVQGLGNAATDIVYTLPDNVTSYSVRPYQMCRLRPTLHIYCATSR